MKLSAAISEAFLISLPGDCPVCHAVLCCLMCAGWTLPCHSSLQSASDSEFQCHYFGSAPRCKWEQHPNAGRSKQRFGEYLLACDSTDTRQISHFVPGLLHLLPRVELPLHPCKQAATNVHNHPCYLLWLLTAAPSIPSILGWSPTRELRHLFFGKGPHSHESKHGFHTTI